MEQDILILDEATSMLDPEGTKEISDLIKYLNKSLNKTIITITHDLEFAKLSDYIVVLKDGKIILEGMPQDVFKEEELLKSSHLELPFGLSLYNELLKDENKNNRLLEALWAFNSKT
jgi:energy-coupling factor transport system ATP-binding protein